MSGSSSPTLHEVPDTPASVQTMKKKKKKKKSKKSGKAKSEATAQLVDEDCPPVLCISRNKHWRYISSYHTLGINLLGNIGGTGRNVAMSAVRIHRLRALAVHKLALAYKADKIMLSVMVMQGGSVFDDIAERVLKFDPDDPDTKYVHFFHEKVLSCQLAELTTTQYPEATKDFTYALKESRTARKAKVAHTDCGGPSESRTKSTKKRKNGSSGKTNGQAPLTGMSTVDLSVEGQDGEPLCIHLLVLPDAPDPIKPQLLFLHGAAYLQHAAFLIEATVLQLKGIHKAPSTGGAELQLCYLENGKYSGVEMGHPDGPLGKASGAKARAYRDALGEAMFKDQVTSLLKKSIHDHNKFLTHFDTLESPNSFFDSDGDLAKQVEYTFLLSESIRPGNQANGASPHLPLSDTLAMFMTYHPLLMESHFSVLICQLMLTDFLGLLKQFVYTARLEGCPMFLPARSMAQAEFIKVLERLTRGWKNGIQPHSLSLGCAKGWLAIAPPLSPAPILVNTG
ncbi:hypothetical protein IW261DRAFT_1506230, partial [Armillaria novae-zelandiae]